MKKTLVVVGLMLIGFLAEAQNVKMQTAYNYLRRGLLDKAVVNIDEASIEETTKMNPKTWYYRGWIYMQVSQSEKYNKLDAEALYKANESLIKVIQLDTAFESIQDVYTKLDFCAKELYNKGAILYNQKNYADAVKNFDYARTSFKAMGNVTIYETFYNATYYAAISATYAGNKELAISYLEELIALGLDKEEIYEMIAPLYSELKKTDKLSTVITKGRAKFPDNYNLLIIETNMYMTNGEMEKAQKNLLAAIERKPNDPMLYHVIGSKYNDLLTEESYKKELKTYESNSLEAEKYYKKAIEVEPTYFDSYFNLGALYVNKAVLVLEAANKLDFDDPKYPIEEKRATDMLKQSLPILEKAHELNPKDYNTIVTLKEIYAKTKQYDKSKAMGEKLEALGQ